MKLIHVKATILALLTLSVLATLNVVQLPQANAAIGTHPIYVVYYQAYIYDDHDGWPLGAGEWYFQLSGGGDVRLSPQYSRDGPGYVDFSDIDLGWFISGNTQFNCMAMEEDGIWPANYWDYTSRLLVIVPFPGASLNTWNYGDGIVGDVRHYYYYYIQNLAPSVGSISGPESGYRLVPYTFTTSGSDPEGDSITFEWMVDGVIQAATGSSLTYTFPTSAANGAHTISVRTRDYLGRYSAYSATKLFETYNRPPSVGAISGPSYGYTGIPYMFSTTGSDPDGDPITYEWSVNWAIQAATGPTMTYTFPTAGVFQVRVRTRDDQDIFQYSDYARAPVGITTAKLNTLIAFSFSPNPANPGQSVTLSGTLKTVGGNPVYPAVVTVEYSANGGVTWISAWTLNTNAAGQFSNAFNAPGVGTYQVRVNYAGSATYNPSSKTETLVVQTGAKLNTQIVFSFSPNPASPGQTVTLSGTLKDVNGNPVYPASVTVVYSTNGGVTWNYVFTLSTDAAGQFSQSFRAPPAGTYLARISYAGSVNYNPSSSTQTLTVK